MNWWKLLRPRVIVLLILWSLPVLLYVVVGLAALYETGWLFLIAWMLPLLWLIAWLVGRSWPAPKLHQTASLQPMKAPQFWTPRDAAAIEVVEAFRREVPDIDWMTIVDPERYIRDTQALAERLAEHYHTGSRDHALHPLTLVEVFAVIHLAVEDLEEWTLENVPGSRLATIGHLQRLPQLANAVDIGQKFVFVAAAIANPAKLLAYPIWRKSGRVVTELQDEVVRALYQQYLRQVGYYLIEMYSGRLRGGSRRYRQQFGHMAGAVHQSGGDIEGLSQLQEVSTTIAVIGQVKAGKSSLINILMKDKVAATSILPETREVQRFRFELPGSNQNVSLLDTPGYSEADVTPRQRAEIRAAAEAADMIILVMAANVSARHSDVQIVEDLKAYYRENSHLKPPVMIAVLTHIDRLRPVREWSPPYHWRTPKNEKERSIAEAVQYLQPLFGDSIAGYAAVFTGDVHPADSSVTDEVVPKLVEHLHGGHAAAVLKAFYRQLSENRRRQLSQQVKGLLKMVGRAKLGRG